MSYNNSQQQKQIQSQVNFCIPSPSSSMFDCNALTNFAFLSFMKLCHSIRVGGGGNRFILFRTSCGVNVRPTMVRMLLNCCTVPKAYPEDFGVGGRLLPSRASSVECCNRRSLDSSSNNQHATLKTGWLNSLYNLITALKDLLPVSSAVYRSIHDGNGLTFVRGSVNNATAIAMIKRVNAVMKDVPNRMKNIHKSYMWNHFRNRIRSPWSPFWFVIQV